VTARCPECQTRYRIAREKIGARGARLRCTRCETTFRVQAPGAAGSDDDSLRTEREVPPPRPAAGGRAQPAPTPAAAPSGSPARALVADSDAERAKRIAAFLTRYRIAADVVHDGREALLRIFRTPPQLLVLGPKLARLDAPALCEVVRRSPVHAPLRLIRIAVAGEAPEAPAYDAHLMLEVGDVPEGLGALLERVGVGAKPSPGAPAAAAPKPAAPAAPAAPRPAPRPAAPVAARSTAPAAAPAASDASAADPAVAAALRLARIVVSDIVLYNPDKFAAAAAAGNAARTLAAELEEARAMFNQRVPEKVRAGRDFLIEELERRARAARA
jgi:predicted Zn finger-like uncharacterized protein